MYLDSGMYLDHFKFSQLPFSVKPNMDNYCGLPTHEKLFNDILTALQKNTQVLSITGKTGLGKTLLSQRLIHRLEANFTVHYTADFDKEHAELCLSITEKNPEKTYLLILDNAHNLSSANLKSLQHLLELQSDKKNLVQVILLGNHAPRKMKKQINVFYKIKALTKKEIIQYFSHCLYTAGSTNKTLFSNKAQKNLFRAAAGSPRQLNILAHKALLISFKRGISHVDTKSIRQAIADTESILLTRYFSNANILLVSTTIICVSVILYVYKKAGLLFT